MSLITPRQVVLDLTAPDRHTATRTLAQTLVASGRCTDVEQFLADVRAREEKMATGLPGGIGIPHARSAAITEPSLVFGRTTGIDWGAKDGPATLVFLIAAPESGGDAHMQMLPKLARALMKPSFRQNLLDATTEAQVVDLVSAEVALDQPTSTASAATTSAATAATVQTSAGVSAGGGSTRTATRTLHFVGVTSVSYTHLDVYKRQPTNHSCSM